MITLRTPFSKTIFAVIYGLLACVSLTSAFQLDAKGFILLPIFSGFSFILFRSAYRQYSEEREDREPLGIQTVSAPTAAFSQPYVSQPAILTNADPPPILLDNEPGIVSRSTEDSASTQSETTRSTLTNKEVLDAALAVHETVTWWISWILAVLDGKGVNRDQASIQMYALFSKMEEITREFNPAVVSLTVTSILNNLATYTLADRRWDVIKTEVLALRKAIDRLANCLIKVLKEEGWQMEQATTQVGCLSKRLSSLDSSALIKSLTFAVAIDGYVTTLIKETMLPEQA